MIVSGQYGIGFTEVFTAHHTKECNFFLNITFRNILVFTLNVKIHRIQGMG